MVRAALPKKNEADEEGRAAAGVLVEGFSSIAATTSGGPVLPNKRVRPAKGGKETGDRHEVIACDPCLPREVWVTRCGWRFAGSPHATTGQGEVTCDKCRRFAATGGGARRPQVIREGGGASEVR